MPFTHSTCTFPTRVEQLHYHMPCASAWWCAALTLTLNQLLNREAYLLSSPSGWENASTEIEDLRVLWPRRSLMFSCERDQKSVHAKNLDDVPSCVDISRVAIVKPSHALRGLTATNNHHNACACRLQPLVGTMVLALNEEYVDMSGTQALAVKDGDTLAVSNFPHDFLSPTHSPHHNHRHHAHAHTRTHAREHALTTRTTPISSAQVIPPLSGG